VTCESPDARYRNCFVVPSELQLAERKRACLPLHHGARWPGRQGPIHQFQIIDSLSLSAAPLGIRASVRPVWGDSVQVMRYSPEH